MSDNGKLFTAVMGLIGLILCGCDYPGKSLKQTEDKMQGEAASNEVRHALESNGIDPDGNYSTEYCQVHLDKPDSMFRTTLRFFPSTNEWPVADAADVLNLAVKHGWQEDWVSADGLQVLLKRASAQGDGDIITGDIQKE